MNLREYRTLFADILSKKITVAPYDQEIYINYIKLNASRMKRWSKQATIDPILRAAILTINQPQKWVLITEPWCGDAANSIPYIEKMADLNPNITIEVQLRDSGSEIDRYLTNGGKSIPKLVARDATGRDLFTWGPRPADAQALILKQKKSDVSKDEQYAEILHWYKQDRGKTMQREFVALLS